MFTIMENRKRPRLELINTNNNNSTNDLVQGVASAVQTTTNAAMGTATLATIGGQRYFKWKLKFLINFNIFCFQNLVLF